MSRHRDVRNLDYEEEYDDVYSDEVYGHSVDEHEYGVSPSVEQYIYGHGRERNCGFGAYLNYSEEIAEEDETGEERGSEEGSRKSSTSETRPHLSSENEVKLNSIMDELRNVVGERYSDVELTRAVLSNNYDFESTLNTLLDGQPCVSSSSEIATLPECGRPLPQKKQRERKAATKVTGNSLGHKEEEGITVVVTTPKVATASKAVAGFTPSKVAEEIPEVSGTSQEDSGKAEDTVDQKLKDSDESRDAKDTPARLPVVRLRDKEVDVEAKFNDDRRGNKELMNLVVVGHVDAGKSTLMGHLLYLKGVVSQRVMHKYEQESKKIGKQSFMYAWVLDDTDEERARGVTVDVAQSMFETPSKIVTLLDAPGHKDFIPNMITGASRADVAVLVVDATTGGFESGFESGGQTREHAVLIRSLGVSQLVVAVNKLDTVNWSEERFKEIRQALKHFLKTAGFRESDVIYVPCSGLTGENLTKSSKLPELSSWYHDITLLEAIDKLKVPVRAVVRPIRMCINDVYKGQGASMCVSGRLETGYIQNGDRLLLMPQGDVVNVKGVQVDSRGAGCAYAGDHATLFVSGVEPSHIHVGDFVCDPREPIPQVSRIQARIVIFNIAVPIIRGSQVDFHYQCVNESAIVRRLVAQLHRSTGEVLKKKPRALTKNTSAVVEIEFGRPLCLELYQNYKEFGRFMLRISGTTIAAGVVTEILN